ncbi:MAG: Ku protein [Solirubrobacteraceae bacterium]
MARAIWSGAISFGLVNVPVKLYSATSPKTVRFNQISGKTGARIKQKRVDASTGAEVAFEDIVKGYELGPDRYIVIDPAELDALDPKATRTIDLEEFVDLEQIDPIYYDSSYYLAPTAGGAKAYRLLLEAMRDAGKVAIGRVVLRSKQQLCALRASGEVLTLSTMLFGDEIVSPESLDDLDSAAGAQASERELAMARQLIESLSSAFDPTRHRDEYRERVLALIEAKASGEQLVRAPQEAAPSPAPDLMAALEASLAAVRADGEPEPVATKRSARARRPAKTAAGDDEGDGPHGQTAPALMLRTDKSPDC